ncbi:MAG TPA: phosphodiesterase, partial [Candidatus Polarisedimenticolia bacterium]|nr:phosphodiesterase [Candidatus Polarisedimenticolia bacterium]
ASDLAPDLTLVLRDYGFVSVLRSDVAVRTRREIVGAHRPQGIFLAAGPGIRRGTRHPGLSILDVTPTLMYSLGLPIPDDFEGRLPAEIFEPEQLAGLPARVGATGAAWSPREERGPDLAAMDAEGEEVVLDRLKSLGYVE